MLAEILYFLFLHGILATSGNVKDSKRDLTLSLMVQLHLAIVAWTNWKNTYILKKNKHSMQDCRKQKQSGS